MPSEGGGWGLCSPRPSRGLQLGGQLMGGLAGGLKKKNRPPQGMCFTRELVVETEFLPPADCLVCRERSLVGTHVGLVTPPSQQTTPTTGEALLVLLPSLSLSLSLTLSLSLSVSLRRQVGSEVKEEGSHSLHGH